MDEIVHIRQTDLRLGQECLSKAGLFLTASTTSVLFLLLLLLLVLDKFFLLLQDLQLLLVTGLLGIDFQFSFVKLDGSN